MALKDEWKKTGTGLGKAFTQLGKSIVHTVSTGVQKADAWAAPEDEQKEAPAEQPQAGEQPRPSEEKAE